MLSLFCSLSHSFTRSIIYHFLLNFLFLRSKKTNVKLKRIRTFYYFILQNLFSGVLCGLNGKNARTPFIGWRVALGRINAVYCPWTLHQSINGAITTRPWGSQNVEKWLVEYENILIALLLAINLHCSKHKFSPFFSFDIMMYSAIRVINEIVQQIITTTRHFTKSSIVRSNNIS